MLVDAGVGEGCVGVGEGGGGEGGGEEGHFWGVWLVWYGGV